MVQKSEPKRRGRPRAYDPAKALTRARDTFWTRGYAATSLDELGAATEMNRPSLYAAFGDKRALYLKTLDAYRTATRGQLADALSGARPLATELRGVYALALASYLADENAPRGCFLVGTAVTEATSDVEVRAMLAAALAEIDAAFAARFRLARQRGEIRGDDPDTLARLASATLYSLAIHARAGVPRRDLEANVDAAVALICRSA